jgi:hypothetical protein
MTTLSDSQGDRVPTVVLMAAFCQDCPIGLHTETSDAACRAKHRGTTTFKLGG